MRRKPTNPDAAISDGVDYLLREFRTLQRPVSTAGAAAASTTGGPIEATVHVAAYNARQEIKDLADFVCDGIADEEEINAAISLLVNTYGGGVLQLSAGDFYVTDYIYTGSTSSSVWIRGMGEATVVDSDGDGAALRLGLMVNQSVGGNISDLTVRCFHNDYQNAIYMEVPDVTAWAAGSYLTVDVDTASSATDLTLTIQYTEA